MDGVPLHLAVEFYKKHHASAPSRKYVREVVDMVALTGLSDIGDKINKQVIQPLIGANPRLARSDFPDFNDPNKLGQGNEMVQRLSNLIGIFQKPELDFSKRTAPSTMTFSGTPTSISCGTSPGSVARAKGNFTPPPRSAGSWRR